MADRAYEDGITAAKTAWGNPIRIDDAVMAPLDKLTVKLEPKQDLHGYSKPWVGGAGKNLIPYVEPGSINQTTGEEVANTDVTRTGFIKVTPGETYTISGLSSAYNIRLFEYKENKVYDSTFATSASGLTHTVTFKSTTEWVRFQLLNAGASETMQFEKGSTATTYEPYENICPISGWDGVNVRRWGENLMDNVGKTMGKYIDLNNSVKTSNREDSFYTDFIPVEEGESYTYSCIGGTSERLGRRFHYYDASFAWVRSGPQQSIDFGEALALTDTVPSGVAYVRVNGYLADTSSFGKTKNQIVTYPISLSAAGGSVYGGQLTLNRDGSGTLTVDRKMFTIPTITQFAGTTASGIKWASISVPDGGVPYVDSKIIDFEVVKAVSYSTRGETWTGYSSADNKFVIWTGTDTTVEFFNEHIAGTKAVALLATPQTFNLTAAQVKTLTGLNHISCDAGEMEIVYRADKYANKTDFLATLPRLTASGNPITLTNGADGTPLKRLSIRIDPKQAGSGTPSPSNIRPISGWDGVNVDRGLAAVIAPRNYTLVSGKLIDSTGSISDNANYHYCESFIPIKPNQKYSILLKPSQATAGAFSVPYYRNTGEFIQRDTILNGSSQLVPGANQSFTTPSNAAYMRFSIPVTIGRTQFMIIEGETSLSFDEIVDSIESFPIPFPASIGTVYGANLVLEQDGSGTLTVDKAIKKLKDLAWQYEADKTRFRAPVYEIKQAPVTRTDVGLMATCYQTIDDERSVGDTPDLSIFNLSQNVNVFIFDSQYNGNLSGFLAARGDTDIVYSLATPITYHLTAPMVRTLLGYNNLISDAGTMEAEYYADIKLYIDSKFEELRALLT